MITENNNHIGSIETESEASPKCATRPNPLPSAHLSAIASAAAEGRGTEGEGEQRVQTAQDSAFSSRRVNRKSSIGNIPHRARGKVATLPKVVRIEVNCMLDDGCSYRTIAA